VKICLSILLIVSHLLSTVGIQLSAHQCGDEVSYSLFGTHFNDHCECDHESEDHDEDCCSSKKMEVKSNKDFKLFQKSIFQQKTSIIIEESIYFFVSNLKTLSNSQTFKCHYNEHPPGVYWPYYLLYRNFRV
jgi:hypothetical protein